MENEKIRKRLLRILDMVPALKETLLSDISLEVKRKKINEYLSNMLIATFDDDPAIPSLEWVLTRDAITAFKAMLSSRSERLAGYSLLRYLDDLLHEKNFEDDDKPSSGFLPLKSSSFLGKDEYYGGLILTYKKALFCGQAIPWATFSRKSKYRLF